MRWLERWGPLELLTAGLALALAVSAVGNCGAKMIRAWRPEVAADGGAR